MTLNPSKLGAEHSIDPSDLLLKDRVLFLSGVVEQEMSDYAVACLLYWDREDPTAEITLIVNSQGGYVRQGMAIYDAIQMINAPVRTIATGWAFSMGAILLTGGTKGRRFALPHASIMIHQPSGEASGDVTSMTKATKEAQKVKTILTDVLVRHTGQDRKKIAKDIDRDYYFTAVEAVEYGIIDGVLGKL